MHWNMYTTDAKNLFLHVLTLLRCHLQEVFRNVMQVGKCVTVLHTTDNSESTTFSTMKTP